MWLVPGIQRSFASLNNKIKCVKRSCVFLFFFLYGCIPGSSRNLSCELMKTTWFGVSPLWSTYHTVIISQVQLLLHLSSARSFTVPPTGQNESGTIKLSVFLNPIREWVGRALHCNDNKQIRGRHFCLRGDYKPTVLVVPAGNNELMLLFCERLLGEPLTHMIRIL